MKHNQWHDTCPHYIEAKKAVEVRAREAEIRAQRIRATFKIIDGGDSR